MPVLKMLAQYDELTEPRTENGKINFDSPERVSFLEETDCSETGKD